MSSWTSHNYKEEGRKRGYSDEYVELLEKDGKALAKIGLPVLFSLGHLAAITNVPFAYLHSVVSRRMDPYRTFRLRKRSGKYRIIAIPDPALLHVQRWIHQHILIHRKIHPCATAYSPGASPRKNALAHCGAKWLVKVDINRFFESISEKQVYHVFRKMGYRALVAFELARVATRLGRFSSRYKNARWRSRLGYTIHSYHHDFVGHLPQGAPTSPMLANLVCIELDNKLVEVAEQMNCVYTRYSDDIVFSSYNFSRKSARDGIEKCSKILSTYGFRKNIQKTHVVPPGARRIVTGLLVNTDKPKLTKEYRDNLSCHLHFANKYGVVEHCKRRNFRSLFGFREHLRGLITYAVNVEPEFARKCQREFDKISWPPMSNEIGEGITH